MADFQAITSDSVAAIRRDVLTTMYASLARTNEALKTFGDMVTSDWWIVRNTGNVCMKYDVIYGIITNPRVVHIADATRFTEQTAKHTAAQTFNGDNTPAHAVRFIQALREEQEEVTRLIAGIEE